MLVFAALSFTCAVRSEGFIAADACTHYLYAKYAFQEPVNLVDVWARPLVTALYALPAQLGGRLAVRLTSLLVALGCGWVAMGIARGQGIHRRQLALIFTLGQPLLFLHSFGEMTELPFALLWSGAFWAYQAQRWGLMAVLAAFLPAARPEGFPFLALAGLALVLHRKWRWLAVLPVPLLAWDLSGWELTHRTSPWWRWLIDAWPYSADSLYGRGSLFTFVAQLPVVVGPAVLPATLVGLALAGWAAIARRDSAPDAHQRRCRFLIAALPMLVLIGHSLLRWLGKFGSFGEARYLLVVAPLWGVLSAWGWEWLWPRLNWRHPLRWAAVAALSPVGANIIDPVVPIKLSEDWRAAQRFAAWYDASPVRQQYPHVLASHPGVFWFLDESPTGQSRGGGFSRNLIAALPPGTLLVWDPSYSGRNASADQATTVDEIRSAGWIEDDAAEAAIMASLPPRARWHIYRSRPPE